MTLSIWTAGIAILAVPIISGLQHMQPTNPAQMPAACILQHVEYLDPATGKLMLASFKTYDCGAGLGVIGSGK